MHSTRRTKVVCGVDIGSTNVKVVLLAPHGEILARVVRSTPRDGQGLCIEGDALLATVEDMIAEACADGFEVQAVCVAGMGEDGMRVDETLTPMTRALAWFDSRRQGVLRSLKPDSPPMTPSTRWRTPAGPSSDWPGPPADLGGAGPARSWIAATNMPGAHWSGTPVLSDTLASRTGAWRARDRSWAPELIPSLLSPVLAAAAREWDPDPARVPRLNGLRRR